MTLRASLGTLEPALRLDFREGFILFFALTLAVYPLVGRAANGARSHVLRPEVMEFSISGLTLERTADDSLVPDDLAAKMRTVRWPGRPAVQ